MNRKVNRFSKSSLLAVVATTMFASILWAQPLPELPPSATIEVPGLPGPSSPEIPPAPATDVEAVVPALGEVEALNAGLADLLLIGDVQARVAQIDARLGQVEARVGSPEWPLTLMPDSTIWLRAYVHNSRLRVTVNGEELGVYDTDTLAPVDRILNYEEMVEYVVAASARAQASVNPSVGTLTNPLEPLERVEPVWFLSREQPNSVTFSFDRAGLGNEVYLFHVEQSNPTIWSPIHRFTPTATQLEETYELTLAPGPVVAAFSAAPETGAADGSPPPSNLVGAAVVGEEPQGNLLTRLARLEAQVTALQGLIDEQLNSDRVAQLEAQVNALQARLAAPVAPQLPEGALAPPPPGFPEGIPSPGSFWGTASPEWYSEVWANIEVNGSELRISINGVELGAYYGNAQVPLTPVLIPGQSNTVVFSFDRAAPGNKVLFRGQVAGGHEWAELPFEPSAERLSRTFEVRLTPSGG